MNIITPEYLRGVRVNALRKRTWFKALDRVERGIVDLTIKMVKTLKSHVLAGEIVKILVKLKEADKGAFTRHIESYGYQKLKIVVAQAASFGSNVAHSWLRELDYAAWLALNNIYNPVGWRCVS